MKVDIRDANLPELVARVQAGEEVVIEDGAVPVARLVSAGDRPGNHPGVRFDSLAHLAGTAPDFPPIPDEEIERWEREESERILAATGYKYP